MQGIRVGWPGPESPESPRGPGGAAVAGVMLERAGDRPSRAGRGGRVPAEVHDGPLGAALQPPRGEAPTNGRANEPGVDGPRAGRRGRPRPDRSAQRRRPGSGRRRGARRDDPRRAGRPPLADDPGPGPGPDRRRPLDRAEHLGRRLRRRLDRGQDRLPPGRPGGRRRPGPAAGAGLRDPRGAGPRRHGRRLQGAPGQPEPDLRLEDDPGRRPRRARGRGPLSVRGRDGRAPGAPGDRPDPSPGRSRRPALPGARVRRWRQSRRSQRRHPAAGRRGGRAGGGPGPGDPLLARPGRRPPRPQALEHPADPRRPGEDRRLRPGQDARHRQPDHGVGPDPGDPKLHGPRAGQRRNEGGRAVGRHLRPGGDPLRPPHGSPAVPRGDDPRDAPAGPGGGPRPPVPPPALAATRRRDDHPEVPPEAPRRPLRHGGGTRGGPAPLPRP